MNKKTVKGEILAIDLGNYNTQACTTKNREFMFESKHEIGIDLDPVDNETIKYEDTCYVMGRGEIDLEFNKAKKNYMPNLLYAIANVTESQEVNIVLNTPIDSLGIGNDFKSELSNKEFKYRYKGEDRTVKINNVAVVGEGMGSLYGLPDSAKGRSLVLIDIGGRTTNVLTMVNGKIEKKFTVNKGIINFYIDLAKTLNSKGENYDLEEMQRLIAENKIDNIKVLEECNENFIKEILNKIKEKIKISTYDKYFTGGGSQELAVKLKEIFKDANFIKESVWANVRGNLKIATNVWEEDNNEKI